jgi:hypothetical protein
MPPLSGELRESMIRVEWGSWLYRFFFGSSSCSDGLEAGSFTLTLMLWVFSFPPTLSSILLA